MHSKEESRINIRDQKESKGAEDAFDDFISELYMALGKKKKISELEHVSIQTVQTE